MYITLGILRGGLNLYTLLVATSGVVLVRLLHPVIRRRTVQHSSTGTDYDVRPLRVQANDEE